MYFDKIWLSEFDLDNPTRASLDNPTSASLKEKTDPEPDNLEVTKSKYIMYRHIGFL